jgi:hypothetical protein
MIRRAWIEGRHSNRAKVRISAHVDLGGGMSRLLSSHRHAFEDDELPA